MTTKKEKKPVEVPAEATTEAIGAELTEKAQEQVETTATADKPEAAAPVAFNLNDLTADQLANLKAALDGVAPANIRPKKQNSTVTLREMDGKLVVSFSNAFQRLVMDPESRAEKMRQHIAVKFLGEDKETTVFYQDFMSAQRVKCEVVSVKVDHKEKQMGEVYHKDLKRRVPQMVEWDERSMTLKLPDGKMLEINEKYVNA